MAKDNDDSGDPEPDDESGPDGEPEPGERTEPDSDSPAGGTDDGPDSGEDMIEQEQPADAEATGAGSDWQPDDDPTATGTDDGTTATETDDGSAEVEVTREENSAAAAIVSFLLPGVGNMMNGDTDRGIVILVLWVVWLVLAWGIGFFLIGGLITLVTFGLGGILWILIGLVLTPLELAIHVLAAVDAYQGSEIVDKVTVKVDEVR